MNEKHKNRGGKIRFLLHVLIELFETRKIKVLLKKSLACSPGMKFSTRKKRPEIEKKGMTRTPR